MTGVTAPDRFNGGEEVLFPPDQGTVGQAMVSLGNGQSAWQDVGTVRSVAVATANGFTGVSSGGPNPVLTLTYQLTAPGPSTLGGVNSIAAVSHQWISSITTAGQPILTQPAFADIAGLGSMAQQSAASVAITGGSITGMPSPVNASDVVTKAYCDAMTSNLSQKNACLVATTAQLTATYNNGSSGVGATLTNSGSQAALSIDSVVLPLNARVLVKDQTSNTFQNGIFSLTNQGSGSTNWVLTRTSDFDGSIGPNGGITAGSYTVIQSGSVNAGTLWVETGEGPFTVGTTPILFTKLSAASQTLTLTGDVTGTGAASIAVTVTQINGVALGNTAATAGHLLIGSGTNWASQTVGGDGTLNSSGSLTITKTNGVNFTSAATTAIGTSGATIPLLNAENTWSAQQDYTTGVSLTSGHALLLNGSADQNWRLGLGINAYTVTTVGSTTSIQVVYGSGSSGPDGMAFGPTGGSSTLELRGDDNSAYFRGPVRMANYSTGVAQFDGSGNLSSGPYAASAATLLGSVLNSTVVTSSLTSVGTIGTGTWQGSVVAGQYGGTGVANTGLTLTLSANNAVSSWAITGNAVASVSPIQITGTIFSGTNAVPYMLISPTGTTLTFPWSSLGTMLAANLSAGFVGDYLNLRRSGQTSPDFIFSSTGAITYGGNLVSKVPFNQFNDSVGLGVLSFDANYVWGFRNSTLGPNELRVYGTYSNGANYERLVIRTAAGTHTIGTENAGTGVARALNIETAGTTAIAIDTSQNVSVSSLTASRPVGTDGSKNLVSLTITGTGAAVLSTGPTLTNPIVGTQSPGDNSTKAASTAYVATAVSNAAYTLPIASTSILGGVKVDGTTITINGSGVISSTGGGSGTVTTISVTANNGITQSVSNPTTTPNITLGLGNITPTSVSTGTVTLTGTLALKNGSNANILNLQAGVTASTITFTLPTADGTVGQTLITDGSQNWSFGTLSVAGGGTGAMTLTGLVKGNGTSAFTSATAGTDYSAGTSGLTTGILKSTTSTGVLSIATAGDFPTLNQNTSGQAGTVATISGLIVQGSNIMITGSGTSGSPYSIAASGSANPTFDTLTSGTNTTAAMLVGTGASLGTTGTGTIAATTVVTNANLSGVVTSVGNTTSFGSFTSATLAAALSDETGTGAAVFATSPTLVTPILGTPTSGNLANCTFPTLNQNTTGNAATVTTNANLSGVVTSVGNTTSFGSFISGTLRAAITDSTGTGAAVFGTSPALSGTVLLSSQVKFSSPASGVLMLANFAATGFTGIQYGSATAANTAGSNVTETASLSTGTGVAGTLGVVTGFAGVSQATTVTVTIANPAVFSLTAHGFVPGSSFTLTTTGALPTGLATATTYYVIATGLTANAFQASATPAGSAIVTTGSQSGTHTLTSTTTVQNPGATIATWGPSANTGSQAINLLNLAQVWNTSSSVTAILMNITMVAAGGSSNLMDLQVGGSSMFKVSTGGNITSLALTTNTWNNSNGTVSIWQGAASSNNATFMVAATTPIMRWATSTSASFGIKRSGTTAAFRLADDSADAPITAAAATFSGTVNNTTLTASNIVMTDGSKNLTSLATLTVSNGGTGVATLTGIVKGNGTSAFSAATAGTDFVAPGTVTAFTAQQYFAEQTLIDASTITWNANTQQAAFVLLTSAVGSTRVLGFPSNIQAGATYTIVIKQSSTGSNAITYGAGYLFPGGTAFVLSTANNAIDVLTFVCHGSNLLGVGQKAFA